MFPSFFLCRAYTGPRRGQSYEADSSEASAYPQEGLKTLKQEMRVLGTVSSFKDCSRAAMKFLALLLPA